jgi:hypothetical protein
MVEPGERRSLGRGTPISLAWWSQGNGVRARAKRRLIDAILRREGRRIAGGIVMLVLALVAVGVFAGFRTHVFLCAEVVATALVLGLCARVDVTRRRRGRT